MDLESLTRFHGHLDGVRWRLTPLGLLIEGETAPRGSGGPPLTIRRIWDSYGTSVRDAAVAHGVPFELILATIATESRGNPLAERAEPGFVSYAATPHRVSLGLMQTLISTAREATGKPALTAEDLRRPSISIDAGAAYIRRQLDKTGFDPPKVACAYNAGGIYDQTSAGNRWRMRQYPIGTGAHADRFVAWLNDCFIHFADPAAIAGPSLIRELHAHGGDIV